MRLLLLLLSLTLISSADQPSIESLRAKGAFVAVVVKDIDASTKWYEQNLGVKLLKKGTSPKRNAGNAVLAGDDFYVELMYFVNPQAKAHEAAADGSRPPGIRKAGAILDRAKFDALYSRLEKGGAKFRGGIFEDQEMKLSSFIVLDNEENLIQFFAPSGVATTPPVASVSGSVSAISVPDVTVAAKWYQDKLGFQLVKQGELRNGWKFALLRFEDHITEILQNPGAKPLTDLKADLKDPVEVYGIFKLGFTVRDLDGVMADLKRRGAEVDFEVTKLNDLGMRAFGIRDNNGNLIQFFGR